MKILYKDAALRDIEETHSYIADGLKNKTAAHNFVSELLRTVSLLTANPQMGIPLRSKYEIDTNIRFLVVKKQLVFYQIEEDTISVIRVLDGRRDYISLLFKDK